MSTALQCDSEEQSQEIDIKLKDKNEIIITKDSNMTALSKLNEMKLNELKKICKDNGIKGVSNLNKNDILNKIKERVQEIVQENINKISAETVDNSKKDTVNDVDDDRLKFIDLFCGIGGFHLALEKLNCKCVLACDIDKKCCETYKNNFNMDPVNDVKKIDEKTMPDFDILCAGFPCQPFSNGGKKQSFKDSRGLLFDEIIRIAKHKQPRFMFLENVKHILKVSDGKVFEYIKVQLASIGYKVQIFELSPHNYGIPQQRERVFFVCVRNDLYNNKEITLQCKNLNLTINDIINNEVDKKYEITKDIRNVLDAWDEIIKQFEVGEKISPTILIHDYFRIYSPEEYAALPYWKKDYMEKNKPLIDKYESIIKPWYHKYKDILSKREIYGKLEWQVGIIKENDSIYNYFIQMRQSGIRVKKPYYFPTLVAISQIPIYGKNKCHLTPRQCARLQCFPETFKLDSSDAVVYKQMGNSVNVYNVFSVINSTLMNYNFPSGSW